MSAPVGRRRRPAGGPTGSPAWMTTFSDLVTQILIFFVLLFSMASIDRARFAEAAASVRHALGTVGSFDPGGLTSAPAPGEGGGLSGLAAVLARDRAQLEGVREQVVRALQAAGVADQVSLSLEERGLVVRFGASILFDAGRADLRPESMRALEAIAGVLRAMPNDVRVEGHTDNRPIQTERFPSNWELSTARATAVVRLMVVSWGLSPARLAPLGYGEHRPIGSNDTAEGMALNRRVDIVILRLSLSEAEPR